MSDPKLIYMVGAKTKRRKENTTKMGLERGGSGSSTYGKTFIYSILSSSSPQTLTLGVSPMRCRWCIKDQSAE
jgi:hypothetical protein